MAARARDVLRVLESWPEGTPAAESGVAGVQSDGRTVWVHLDGFTVGRFSQFGIDIHTADASGCIDCTHEKPKIQDWFRFQSGILQHFGIVVTDEHKPAFLELP